jgi:hypothetical protein
VTGPAADTAELIERGDLDELVRQVDRLVDTGDWAGLVDLRDRARRALERGKQLWPAASLAEYRLALEAPGEWAAKVVTDSSGRFTLGPLPEVAACTHGWEELAPHLTPGPAAVLFAHERVIRGEDLTDVELPGPQVLDLPLALASWEPAYPVAAYRPDKVDFPMPDLPAPTLTDQAPDRRVDLVDDLTTVGALRSVAKTWITESNGRADAVAVEGGAVDAIGALRPPTIRLVELSPAQAIAALAWVGASGGAHGRRRGMAAGRFEAWWAAAALCGFDDDHTPSSDELGEAIAELRWWRWDANEPLTGWELRLAVEDPADGLAWALAATDFAL